MVMKKVIVPAILLLIVFSSLEAIGREEDKGYYPTVCFFPAEEARWDGGEVTTETWHLLTDFQQAMFVFEYAAELRNKYDIFMDVNEWTYWLALGELARKGEGLKIAMTQIMEDMFITQRKNETESASNKPSRSFKYVDGDNPSVCFFPAAKARWDGCKVTSKTWYHLTKYQQIMFIFEYEEELKRRHNTEFDINEWGYWIDMGGVARKEKHSDMPMTKILEDLLLKRGVIKSERD